MKPLDRLPPIPEQAGFMRVQVCLTTIQQFCTDAEYKAIRGRVCQWDFASDEAGSAIAARSRAWREKAG